jgi:hypothetical protein
LLERVAAHNAIPTVKTTAAGHESRRRQALKKEVASTQVDRSRIQRQQLERLCVNAGSDRHSIDCSHKRQETQSGNDQN